MAGASTRSRTGGRIELPAGPGFRCEVRPLPLNPSICGVWDTHRNDWAGRPNLSGTAALKLCRQANEAWASGVDDALITEAANCGSNREAPTPTIDETAPDGNDTAEAVPRASRARLREMLVKGLLEDFERRGREAIAMVRSKRPIDYLRMVAAILREEPPEGDGEPAVSEIRGILVRPPR